MTATRRERERTKRLCNVKLLNHMQWQRICTLINKTHEDDCREIPTSDQVCYTSTEPNQPATCVIEHAIVPIRAVEPVDRHTN